MARSAQTAVLETAELLEMMILELPARQVLTQAQAVSRLWYDTITTSPKIQQALFLRPVKDYKTTAEAQYDHMRPLHEVKLSTPLSTILATPGRTTMLNDILGLDGSATKVSSLPLTSTSRRKGMNYEHASWRRMLSTQPPTKQDFLVANYLAIPAHTSYSKDSFTASEKHNTIELAAGGSFTLGSYRRLGALQFDDDGAGITMEMVARVVAGMHKRFGRAENKGKRFSFTWGKKIQPEIMIEMIADIAENVEAELRVLQRQALQ